MTLKKYEAMLIFLSSMQDDAVEKAMERVKSETVKLNGKIASAEVLGERTFARPLSKKTSGRYVRMRFEMSPADVNALKARLKLNEDVFRVQICCEEDAAPVAATEKAATA